MVDDFNSIKNAVERIPPQVQLVKPKGGMIANGLQIGFFQGAGIVGNKGIRAHDGMPGLKQSFTEVRADKSGRPSDQTFHD
jgi:hypothetical protein